MNEVKYTILGDNKLKIENLSNRNIIYRNFSGRTSQYNKNGDLKFTIVIGDQDAAQMLSSYGWNVKVKPPRNEGEEPFCTLDVKIRLDLDWARPKIKQFTRGGSVWIDASNIKNFDDAEFETVDLVLRQYAWSNGRGESGISAQLSEMYARIAEGVLEAKWAEEEGPGEDALPWEN
ncbi:MAG: hypothetical protein E7576_06965 [Ruminococcaceae bacterium]|nr:hypothetical protein [Oscillospiraceae bacterium]